MPKDFKTKDLIAILVILLFGLFKITGHNGTLDPVVMLTIGYYFARRADSPVVVNKEIAEELTKHKE